MGWGLFSAVAGALIDAAGLQAGFAASLLLAMPCVYFAMRMRFTFAKDRRRSGEHSSQSGVHDARHVAAGSLHDGKPHARASAARGSAFLRASDEDDAPLLQPGGTLEFLPDTDDAGTLQPLVSSAHDRGHRQSHASDGNGSNPAQRSGKHVPAASELSYWAKLRCLLRRPPVLLLCLQALTMGFGVGVIGEYLFVYLDQLGGSDTLMGLSLTVSHGSSPLLKGCTLALLPVQWDII